MKRCCLGLLFSLFMIMCFSVHCHAAQWQTFDDEIGQIEDSIDDGTAQELDELGISGIDDLLTEGVDSKALWTYLLNLLRDQGSAPLSALLLMTAVLILASIAESYTFSLRYTDTKDIMGLVVSLFLSSVVIRPVTQMVSSAVTVIGGASSLLTVYLPVMIGILAFSGHAIASGGYYAAVLTASQLIARLSTYVLEPLLNMILSLSLCAGFCSHIRLCGLIETVSKGFKYLVTFAMSIFVAILGLNGALSSAADSVANKAAKFSLSSFIPLIGSSISEAYGAIQGSVGVLRSGAGVFVILAVFVSFAPLLAQTALWSLTLFGAKTVGDALSVNAASSVLGALSQFIAALRTVLIAVMTVFIISSAIMMKLGGTS